MNNNETLGILSIDGLVDVQVYDTFVNEIEELPKLITDRIHTDFPNLNQDISIEYTLENFDKRAFKRLFKLPRKKKKKIYGTVKAKKRLFKRMRLGLPITKKDLERAKYEVTFI